MSGNYEGSEDRIVAADQRGLNALFFSSFTPGEAKHVIENAQSEIEREMIRGEYCYLQADFAGARSHLEQCIHAEDPEIRAFSLWHYANAMATSGDHVAFEAAASTLIAMPCNGDRDLGVLISQAALLSTFFLPKAFQDKAESLFSLDSSKLPPAYRISIMYIKATLLFLQGKFDEMLFVVKTIIFLFPSPEYPMIDAGLSILCGIVYFFTNEKRMAERFIRRACDILRPDGFMTPLIVGSANFSSKLIDKIEAEWPECAEKLRDGARMYQANRIKAHNRLCGTMMTTILTRRESEVVMLAANGMSNKEIAERLSLSANTVRTVLYNVFNKLRINQRSELSEFIHVFKPEKK